jgi:hypothetical protein
MKVYKITYYSYDKESNCYCEEFSRIGTTSKNEDELDDTIDSWNAELSYQDISGVVTCSSLYLDNLDDYSINDLIEDIKEL